MLLHDRVPITTRQVDGRGFMTAAAKVSRTGVQQYLRSELGLKGDGSIGVNRPASQIFADSSLQSFRGAPVTVGHPAGGVTAKSWRDLAVGHVLDSARKDEDGIHVSATLQITEADTVASIADGAGALSVGYMCELINTPGGKTPDGQSYEFEQANVVVDHIALVEVARCGPTCRVSDDGTTSDTSPCVCGGSCNQQGGKPVTADIQTRAVTVDGVRFSLSDQAADLVARLQQQISDALKTVERKESEVATVASDHVKAITALDGQLAALRTEATRLKDAHQGEVAALTATHQQALAKLQAEADVLRAQTSDAALDARVTARTTLITQARRVLGDSYDATGRTDIQVRRDVVAKALPSLTIGDDKPEAYVQAAYDSVLASPTLAAPPVQDPLRQAPLTAGGFTPNPQTADAAQPSSWELNRRRLETSYLNAGKVA